MRWRCQALVVCLGVFFVLSGDGTMAHAGTTQKGRGRPKPSPGQRSEMQWTVHQDPAGFSVEIPRGWKVRSHPKTGQIDVTGTSQERVTIVPFFIRVRLDTKALPEIFKGLAREYGGGAEWQSPRFEGKSTLRMTGKTKNEAVVSAMTWFSSGRGTAGILYVTSAPEERYGRMVDVFGRILKSFRIQGKASGESGRTVLPAFVVWKDPLENAFSIEVPKGWKVDGGLHRLASVDTRVELVATSPDNGITIRIGDKEIPPFVEPNPTLTMSGFPEGSLYSPGYGVVMLVKSYRNGVDFAEEYARSRYGEECQDLEMVDRKDRRDMSEAFNEIYRSSSAYGVGFVLTAGEVAFTCTRSGRKMKGYFFAGTQRSVVQGTGLGPWSVQYLAGFIAESEQAETAEAIGEHMVKTLRINPEWLRMQKHLAGETSRIVSETHAKISNLIRESYWSRQAVMDELDRRRSRAILGVVDVVDPATGKEYQVESSSDYYWIDHRGNIVGTDTSTIPNIDFRELLRLP
ncbi:MAG: hypothetical protein V2G42_07700 [bacterium JZ-2024 1]